MTLASTCIWLAESDNPLAGVHVEHPNVALVDWDTKLCGEPFVAATAGSCFWVVSLFLSPPRQFRLPKRVEGVVSLKFPLAEFLVCQPAQRVLRARVAPHVSVTSWIPLTGPERRISEIGPAVRVDGFSEYEFCTATAIWTYERHATAPLGFAASSIRTRSSFFFRSSASVEA